MRPWPILVAAVVGVFAVVGLPTPALAIDVNVTTTADELTSNGLCSLREAIRNMTVGFQQNPDCGVAGPADRIVLGPGTFTLTRPGFGEDDGLTGDLDIKKPTRIVGAGPQATSIRAGDGVLLPVDRAFHVQVFPFQANGSLDLSNLEIRFTHSTNGGGGAILANGPVTLTDVVISNATANEDGGAILATNGLTLTRTRITQSTGDGSGAISASGAIVIRDSEILGNLGKVVGAIDISGATSTSLIERTSVSLNTVTGNPITLAPGVMAIRYPNQPGHEIVNSTVSSNISTSPTVTAQPAIQTTGALKITHSTIAFNQSVLTPALRGGFVELEGTIVSNNIATGGSQQICFGNMVSRGNNLAQNGCIQPPLALATDQLGVDPQLGTLQNNGGFGFTHAITTASLAFDKIKSGFRRTGTGTLTVGCETGVSEDQRGLGRPQGSIKTGKCDVGAFELQVPGTGVAVIDPEAGSLAAGEKLTILFGWVTPAPKNWHDLRTLELRFRDGQGVALWIRWDEATQAFQLVNPDGSTTAAYPGGTNQVLTSPLGSLYLSGSSTTGSGPTGPGVVLTLEVSFAAGTPGRTFTIEALAAEDSGAVQGFDAIGTLTITGIIPVPSVNDGNKDDTPRKLTEDQRRQKARTNQAGSDDERTEGNVLDVRCDGLYAEVDIANRDGVMTVRLIHDSKRDCPSIQVGDYLEASGQKEHEQLFYAHDVDFHRPRD